MRINETISQLYEATERTISSDTYPGYPTKRLVVEDAQTRQDLTLPDGEWSTRVTTFPSLEVQQKLVADGYELDRFGRPLHPWLRDMLSSPEVGVVTGLGEYWHWGPNYTADPIVLNGDPVPKLLLIQRGDTGKWALPGGFVDGEEDAATAARREVFEEAGLILAPDAGREIYSGVVADARTTAHAWAETTAIIWKVAGTPKVRANDDAVNAEWFAIDDLPADLHGSHAVLIETALKNADALQTTHALSTPESALSFIAVDDGHMTYRRYIITGGGKQTFIKAHDTHAFTDPEREYHSRGYLQKEKRLYDHLKASGFQAIPSNVELSDDTLFMEAYDPSAGWQWRAPADATNAYISDLLAAIEALQNTPQPDSFHDSWLPTHQVHSVEGWDGITADTTADLRMHFAEWSASMTPPFQDAADNLLHDLPLLQARYTMAPPVQEFVLCHHDLRQANVSWHEAHGAKIVDWSWAGLGVKDSDSTSLLIDLHKSGHDVSQYMQRFNQDHALTLIGFWLNHSLWPTRSDDRSVRFHQAVSAVAAYDLLMKQR